MKFTSALLTAALVATVAALPMKKRDVDPSLIPSLGFQSGVNPDGTGNCDGAVDGSNGQPIKVPCSCPPSASAFAASLNADVAAGHAVHNPSVSVSFPTDNSVASQITRVQTAIVVLQNLNGPGQGCPAASTTLSAQLSALQNGTPAPASVSVAPAPASSSAPATTPASSSVPAPAPSSTSASAPATSSSPAAPGALSTAQIDALTPQFGHAAGVNPTGTGDCDGAVNGSNGQPIKVPCSCPPDRATFIASLQGDIEAGHATNNPSVAVSFPTDNSPASQRTRIQAAIVALQNLNGSGQGCPASSTTFSAQLAAIQG